MDLPWTFSLFALATAVTIPLYLFILFAILWRPKLTPFHTLMVSQGMADIYSLLSYNFFIVLRKSGLCNDLYWGSQPIMPIASFITTYFTLYLRCIGIALISVQRYVTVCLYGTTMERGILSFEVKNAKREFLPSLLLRIKTGEAAAGTAWNTTISLIRSCGSIPSESKLFEVLMMETPPHIFGLLHWLSGLLMTATLLTTSFDIKYDNKEDLNMVVPVKTLSLANLISVISVVILFLICILCYVSVISSIIRSKIAANSTRKQEIRLSIQVAGLLVAFLLVFVYSVGNYVINELRQTLLLYNWRELSPIMYGFLSCVLPWTCLFFNEDIQKRLPRIFKCRRRRLNHRSPLASRASAW